MIYKALLVASLALFVVSVFLPWLSESDKSPLAIYPPIRYASQFWSYQAVINILSGDRVSSSFTIRFQEYWFPREFINPDSGILDLYPHLRARPDIYRGWLFVFAFQMLGVAAGALSIVKEKVKGHPLPLIFTVATTSATLTLGYCQFLNHSGWEGLGWLKVNLEIGFFFATVSIVLWLISLLTYAFHLKIQG